MSHLNQIVLDKIHKVKTPREAHNIGKLGVKFFFAIVAYDNETQLNLTFR